MNLADVCIVILVPPCLFLRCIMAARSDSRLNFEHSCKTEVCLYFRSASPFSHMLCREPPFLV